MLIAKEAPCSRREQGDQLGQRDVLLRLDRAQHHVPERLDAMRAEIPALGLRRNVPVARNTRTQRIAVATPMPNRSAAARRDAPASTAAITRPRRSSDKVLAIAAGLQPQPAA